MELRQLRYFVAVAETGSFSRAAVQCGVAQPSLSQQIKRLEADLGRSLFDRLSRSIALTEAGEALLPRARRILAEVRETTESLSDDGEPGGGRLDVGAIPTMAPYVLPQALTRFTAERPGCRVTVREDLTERLVEALIDCELDFAIMSTPVEHDLIELARIAREPLLVATAAGDAPPAKALRLADLRDQPTVVLHEMHCLGQQIQGFCSARGVSRRIVCHSTQLSTVLALVGLGMGISLVPAMCAEQDVSGERRYSALVDDAPTRGIAVAWRRGRSRSSAAQAFAAIMAGQFPAT